MQGITGTRAIHETSRLGKACMASLLIRDDKTRPVWDTEYSDERRERGYRRASRPGKACTASLLFKDDKIMPPWDRPRRVCVANKAEVGFQIL